MLKSLTSKEIISKYLEFYKQRGHKQIPNVSLVPEGDSTLLFVNSGMFPLVPYLSGEKHPLGSRLVNIQRSVRFDDLPEIGDPTHTLAFHMIGNWSLGDYFKDEQLPWAYEFFVKELGLDPKRLFATVFEGDEYAPRDTVSIEIIKRIFKEYGVEARENERIFACGRSDNWWQRGDAVGELGGPDSEVFYYIGDGEPPIGKKPSDFPNEFIELGNSVFMQYRKTSNGWEELPQKNVDFGGGLERTALAVQGKKDIFETDNFWPIIQTTEKISGKTYAESDSTTKAMRIVSDHIRAAVFLAMDGVTPNNKDQGYALRRLLRRIVRYGKSLGVEKDLTVNLIPKVVEMFSWLYPQLNEKQATILEVFSDEEEKFGKTLFAGYRQAEKMLSKFDLSRVSTEELVELSFELYQSLGYPLEIFIEDLKDRNVSVDVSEFNKLFNTIYDKHQELSRVGSESKFKGGLADHSEAVVKYHTTTHLLQMALRKVLGEHVRQVGSNITGERLRFDFSHADKLTDEQISQIEKIINEVIENSLAVNFLVMPREKAEESGALFLPNESYPSEVKVYFIGDNLDKAVSKEFCGGPHVRNTSEIGKVKIYKQERIGEGKARVYLRFED